ncbi:thiamine pyrophosphate-binding protein [Streptomyces collinus]|uniref:Acetolactate synthase n=1 Tax=Streptomyces collinus (strain DSM 40733 / Tue 365) TaxID=1214242 RepID=S5VYL5_STRC3|nr:thiamine pyrophosphate-binding protein [Streptomyces collinus]AGS73090.1 acetolactate synthase [Streptomyces collinus Tu 365]UJA11754.1 thiamine pyrophosphate-binding protein [Streptomyces collinus]UJA13380.1 thiamine pyrophosphate-binding protein [Streptomyces collinus]
MTTTTPDPRAAEPLRLVDLLAAELAAAGVTHLFGVGGANIEDLYDAVHRGGAVRGVVAKHEFSAVTMADGYARSTGRVGVVAATSGGGAMNLVPGLAEAYASRVPVLALVGQPPTGQEGQGAFQDSSGRAGSFDAREVFAPVSRFCARVDDPDSLAELLPRALAAARAAPRGPAVLLLPKDVQQAPVRLPARTPAPAPAPEDSPAAPLDAAAVGAVSDALRGARRVLVIAGEEVAAADARVELGALAGHLGAWVAVTPDAKDVFDNRDPRFAGVAGVMGHANVADCLRRAEVCLLVGTRLPLLARGGLDRALATTRVVSLGPEPPFLPATALGGNLRDALRAVTARLPSRPRARPCPPHAGPVPTALPERAVPAGEGTVPAGRRTVPQARAVAAVEAALPEDAHVFVDAGNTGAAAIHLLPAPRHGRFVVALGMGGMGYTFGAGIGAALATGRRTYVLAGDGAFFMHGMEVHTAVEYDAPVTFVILNNNAHAMCAMREEFLQGGGRADDLFAPADIAAGVAAAFPSLRATGAADAAQLRTALLRANAGSGPALVAVTCDPREIPPFLPFQSFTNSTTHKESSDEQGVVHVG